MKTKETPLKSYANLTFHNINDTTFYIKNMSNDMVLTITTEDNYKYKVEEENTFNNLDQQLWEKKFQDNEKYFVLFNPSIGKVLTAHGDMLKIKGMYACIINTYLLTCPNLFFYFQSKFHLQQSFSSK